MTHTTNDGRRQATARKEIADVAAQIAELGELIECVEDALSVRNGRRGGAIESRGLCSEIRPESGE